MLSETRVLEGLAMHWISTDNVPPLFLLAVPRWPPLFSICQMPVACGLLFVVNSSLSELMAIREQLLIYCESSINQTRS